MCGRYSDSQIPKQLRESKFPRAETHVLFTPRYNIAPTQKASVELVEEGQLVCKKMSWGLFPVWSNAPIINAKQETILTKPTFNKSFEKRRCLVPADGFYEWKRFEGGKIPHRFMLNDGKPFYFAGLWDVSFKNNEFVETFLIVTTSANEIASPVHNRMPVIVQPEFYDTWLDPETSLDVATLVLQKNANDGLNIFPVSSLVNFVRNDSPECMTPATADLAIPGDAQPSINKGQQLRSDFFLN